MEKLKWLKKISSTPSTPKSNEHFWEGKTVVPQWWLPPRPWNVALALQTRSKTERETENLWSCRWVQKCPSKWRTCPSCCQRDGKEGRDPQSVRAAGAEAEGRGPRTGAAVAPKSWGRPSAHSRQGNRDPGFTTTGTEFTNNLTEQETDLPRPSRKERNLPTRGFSAGEAVLVFRLAEMEMRNARCCRYSVCGHCYGSNGKWTRLLSDVLCRVGPDKNTALPQHMTGLWPYKLIINWKFR